MSDRGRSQFGSRLYNGSRRHGSHWSIVDGELDDVARVDGTAGTLAIRLGSVMIACPCCGQRVPSPTAEIAADRYKLTRMEARILQAVWKGKGLPVMAERIFDAMYIDDPDGGPSPAQMYVAFKVALCRLRVKLEGSGISVENVGYRKGYRLVLGA